MASRENLKKLSKTILQKMCIDSGIDSKGKKKEDLISLLFTSGIPQEKLTPVIDISQCSSASGLIPFVNKDDADSHMLPPFDKCIYTVVPYPNLPCPSFLSIYNYMISRSRDSCPERGVQNFKGMDRAVHHFEAGDVQNIQVSQVRNMLSIKIHLINYYIFCLLYT